MSDISQYVDNIRAKAPNEWKIVSEHLKSMLPELPPYDLFHREESIESYIRTSHQRELMKDLLKSLGEI